MRFSLLFLFLLAIDANAQDTFISVQGRLIDRVSKVSIPFASVYIKDKSIGTTTNEEGYFLFHVPSRFAYDTLIISVIGYNSFKSVVNAMTIKENLIELQSSTTLLSEVTVSASKKELTGKEIGKTL